LIEALNELTALKEPARVRIGFRLPPADAGEGSSISTSLRTLLRKPRR
jgi:hypothetical protein